MILFWTKLKLVMEVSKDFMENKFYKDKYENEFGNIYISIRRKLIKDLIL